VQLLGLQLSRSKTRSKLFGVVLVHTAASVVISSKQAAPCTQGFSMF
jgi:hypothetical protein